MTDREKVIEGLEKALAATKAVNRDFAILTVREAKQALELLKEQQEERELIVHWLSKFCIHIDQYPDGIKCSDAERYVFFVNKMHQQFGW